MKPHRISIAFMLTSILLSAVQATAQYYASGTVYSQVLTLGTSSDCDYAWYDPEIYQLPDGRLRMLAQGVSPTACNSIKIQPNYNYWNDYIFSATRETNGVWTTPSTTACPDVSGQYGRCASHFPPNGGPKAVASPAIAKVGSRYFMAFVGGNADYITGMIYWAVSSDGMNWSVYNTNPPAGESVWAPVIYPYYNSTWQCNTDGNNPHGVGQLMLVYDSDTALGPEGGFYLYFFYAHREGGVFSGADSMAYRFSYSSAHSFGFGSSVKQIFQDGVWQTHSGKLVWSYEGGPAFGTDPILYKTRQMTTLDIAAGDIKYDARRGQWVHFYDFNGTTPSSQTTTSLSSGTWNGRIDMDFTTLKNRFPGRDLYYSGVWYGTLGARTGFWVWVPVDQNGCGSQTFKGTAVSMADLNYCDIVGTCFP